MAEYSPEEIAHEGRYVVRLLVKRKVTRFKDVNLGLGQVPLPGAALKARKIFSAQPLLICFSDGFRVRPPAG
jgi:hypothetical protein